MSANTTNNDLENVECQRLLAVAKSHQDHHGSQSEQLWTLVAFQSIVSASSNQCSHVVWLQLCHSAAFR